MQKTRCFANNPNQELYATYHDNEWGRPVYDDRVLFEFLVLEGAQAGLNWETILKKRENYRKAFFDYDIKKLGKLSDKYLDKLCSDETAGIIKNKLKVYSVRKNALVYLNIQQEYGSFSNYIWNFVNNKPIKNNWSSLAKVPASTPLSEAISKDLKKRGMSFVGPTIMYSYMQAVGLVDDHIKTCWLRDA